MTSILKSISKSGVETKVATLFWRQGVAGSIPAHPTTNGVFARKWKRDGVVTLITSVRFRYNTHIDLWCNGSTGGFEPSSLGSNPSRSTNGGFGVTVA